MSIGSANELEEDSPRGRTASFSTKKTLKSLFLFEVVSFDANIQKNHIFFGDDGQSISSFGWVFGCKSQKEAEGWITY